MAFESHVLENGQWVSRTTKLDDLINKNNPSKPARHVEHGPQCGIMTRSVVESPVAHWILSVRLRSSQHNDVAFVGDHYVQISELRRDGQLQGITRKCDFGPRIRNAKVIGTSPVKLKDEQYATTAYHPNTDDDDVEMDLSVASTPNSSQAMSQLPPQLLLVVLETGDSVFLFLRPDDQGNFHFVAVQHSLDSTRLVAPGFHMAVDPGSRYVAQACARNMFVVHELQSMDVLNNHYVRGQPMAPVISSRTRVVNGVIHTVEFLYPRPQDPQHVILLLIVANNGVARMITYDWEVDDDLGQVFAEEKNGHRLPPNHSMPLMIIPLTVRSAFFVVSEEEIAYCADVLEGPPQFEPCGIGNYAPSEQHDGGDAPLWTAWSRPPRLHSFHKDGDAIYVAREDGVTIYLECNTEDILGAYFQHGTFCRVSTAFASLADDASDGEILVFGGDSGLGGVWRATPREPIVKLCHVPNWSPTVDLATSIDSNRWDNFSGATGKTMKEQRQPDGQPTPALLKPDKIFAAAGRGSEGAIVEYRHGLQANIGIEFNFEIVVKRCFMFQDDIMDPTSGYYLLLSVPGGSELHHFDSSFSAASASDMDQQGTHYDLSSPTLLGATVRLDVNLQVTERGIVFVTSDDSVRLSFASLGLGNAAVTDATQRGNLLAITSHVDSVFQLHVITLDPSNLKAEHLCTESFDNAEITSFSLCDISGKPYAITCLWLGEAVYLDFYCVADRERKSRVLIQDSNTGGIEPFTSILPLVDHKSERTVLVAGSRDGSLLTMSFLDSQFESASVSLEKMGTMPVHVYAAHDSGLAFVCCDTNLVLISDFREGQGFTKKLNVWTVDANDNSQPAPAMTLVTALPKTISGNEANMPLLLLADNNILLAELQPQIGPVPRRIPLGMTAMKVLYSHVLRCLVVAASTRDDRPTLRFIDADTGEDLSRPVHGQTKEPTDFLSGLGNSGDRILCLEEWHVTSDSGRFYYILVSTRGGKDGGRVLIVSPKAEKPQPGETRGKIRFWTRHKIKPTQDEEKGPVRAVTGCDRTIKAIMGQRLVYYKLDEGERKLTNVISSHLGAAVWRLSALPSGSRTLALLRKESLTVIEDDAEGQELSITHYDPATRPVLDMLEVAGAWSAETRTPVVSDPPQSIVLVSDQNCGLTGLWVPWDRPGTDCEVLFEADLPCSVRRLRLGRTLPPWARERRKHKKFGLLPASVDDAEILGMGIDGSMQHFTLLDMNVWRFLRFLQNIAETSAELYPFTYVDLEEDDDTVGDAQPDPERGPELQVDGDLMQRFLDKRAMERLVCSQPEWMVMFVEYLDGVDGGKWTRDFADVGDVEARKEAYFGLAYEILEYFLVPVV